MRRYVRVIGLDDDKKSVESFASEKLAFEAFAIVVFQALYQVRQLFALDGHFVFESGERIIPSVQRRGFGYDAFVFRRIVKRERLLLAGVDKDFHVKTRFPATSRSANIRCLKIA